MAEASIANWKEAFEDLSLEPRDTAAPDDTTGTWLEALAEFSRHSFARLLLSPGEDQLRIRLEIALGPPGDDADALAAALVDGLTGTTKTEWDAATGQTPWILQTDLAKEDGSEKLRNLLLHILEVAEHFDGVSSSTQWFQILGGPSPDEKPSQDSGKKTSSDSPFESIGDGSSKSEQEAASSATLESWKVTRVGEALRASIGFSQVLSSDQLSALTRGLESHIHAKFDAQARPIESDDRAELRLPSTARTVLFLEISPGGYPEGLKALKKDIDSFIERLEQFCSYGVDLFEYLGVADTVLGGADDTSDERTLSFDRRAPGPRGPEVSRESPEPEAGIVLDLSSSSATDTLEPKNYTDPRLRRDDATTRLVDVVLRHPGYSDRRIGQVLSILLSVEYHHAIDIADSAPCVIAWGIGRQRARSFKDVIESAGGKVVLVEPGTFGED